MDKYVKYIKYNLFFGLFCEIDDLWKRRPIDRPIVSVPWLGAAILKLRGGINIDSGKNIT